jgi:hypothetical protein
LTATPLTPDSTFSAGKSTSRSIAQTDPALLGRTDSAPLNVMIKYDYDATSSYTGGLAGLPATSPSVTGKKLKDNPVAVTAYEKHTSQVSDTITAAVKQAVPNAKIGTEFQTAYGGIALRSPPTRFRRCSPCRAWMRFNRTRSTSRSTTTRSSSAPRPCGHRSAACRTRART